jgi:electron transfer flavoprotein beta subunit
LEWGGFSAAHPDVYIAGCPLIGYYCAVNSRLGRIALLHSIVCIKQVPDTTNIRIDPETGNLIRQGVPTILNPYDAHAIAAAVEWKRKLGGKVTVITMGPPAAASALRECIELGADRGILISARPFSGADTLATSYALARSIQEIYPVDLVFFGKQAIDGDTAQVGPGVAVRLNAPLITYAVRIRALDLERRTVEVERQTENRNEVIRAPLPAVLTCEKEIATIPYAALPDLIASLRYQPEVWSSDSPVSFDPDRIGLKGSPTMVYKTGNPEKHTAGPVISAAELGVEGAVQAALEMAMAADCGDVLRQVRE